MFIEESLLHESRCQAHDVGLCHLVVFWRCICRRDRFFASVVKHPIVQLFMISAWEYHPEICAVWGIILRYVQFWGITITGGVEVGSEILWVWLLVWKAGPSFREAVSMLIDVPVGKTNLKRQSAALFFAPEIHSKVILWVVSSKLYLFTLLFVFLLLRNHARGL